MKKIISLLLIVMVLSFYGCTPKTTEPAAGPNAQTLVNNAPPGTPDVDSPLSTSAISSDVDSITADIANINTEDTAITPISAEDLNTD